MTTPVLIVVNYGSHALVDANVTRSVPAGTRVVVVDSYSDDAERSAVTDLAGRHGWDLLAPDHNTGFGGGVNLAVAHARETGCDVFVVMNPDAWLPEGAFEALASAATRSPTHLVAPLIDRPDGTPWSRGLTYVSLEDGIMRSAARPPRSERERPWITGACFALTARLWEATGGFDEDYFLYWEDVDFSARVLAVGGGLEILDDVRAVHDEGSTHEDASGGGAKSATYYRYNVRGRLLYAAKQLDPADERKWRRTAWSAAKAIVTQGGRRHLVQSTAPWRAISRGTREGLRWGAEHPRTDDGPQVPSAG